MRCIFVRSSLLLFCLNTSAYAAYYNATTDANNVVGVYPISGQYGLLNRLLSYILWIFVFTCCGKWTWPIIGAVAYNMAYSGTATIHALVLAIVSRHGLYDLDAVGAWAILSPAAMIVPPVIWYSDRLRDSAYRPVFGFWATLVGVGCICCIVALLRDYPEENMCLSSSVNRTENGGAILLTSPIQLLESTDFNCSYGFFHHSQPLRGPSEITAVIAKRLFGIQYRLLVAGCFLALLFGISYSIFGWSKAAERRRTKAELNAALAKLDKHEPSRRDTRKVTLKARHRYHNMQSEHRKKVNTVRYELQTGKYSVPSCRILFLNPFILVIIVAFNEVYLLSDRPLPSSEPAYAVGQWAPWVTVGLALIAAALNAWYTGKWDKKKAILDAELKERELEEERKAIPHINMEIEMGSLSAEAEASLRAAGQAFIDSESHLAPPVAPKPSPGEFTEAKAQAQLQEAINEAERTTPPACVQPLKPRQRLDRFPYAPPTDLTPAGADVAEMTIVQWDKALRAYDRVGRAYDGKVIRDSEGVDWIVQRAKLWHRELWEKWPVPAETSV